MIAAYRWDSNWKILITVLVALPLLLRLGFWQLERGEEKQQLQAQYAAQDQMLPVELINQDASVQSSYQRVYLIGTFDNQHNVLLDNRIYGGVVGYEVLTPFITDNGFSVLVNRGWVAGFANRQQLPKVPVIDSRVRIIGKIYVPLGKAVTLADDQWSEQWPLVVQWEDISRIATALDTELYPYSVRLEPSAAGALLVDWPAVNVQPEKHWGYALQWFLMAAALFVFWLYSSIRPRNKDAANQ
jgi:surfeit locus 1 family protein